MISPREGDSDCLETEVEAVVDEEESDDESLWKVKPVRVKLGLGFWIGRLRRSLWGLD